MTLEDPIGFAAQLTFVHVLDEIGKADPRMAAAIRAGFDRAADAAEVLSMRDGSSEKGHFSTEVLAAVEELRDMTLGKW